MMAATRRLGWQTTIADLALILFMVTAAAMSERPEKGADAVSLPVEAEPSALYRAAADAPRLEAWLAQQPADTRQHLTILARHGPGDAELAARTALDLAAQARTAGRAARIVIEPSHTTDISAVLSYDGRGDWHEHCIASEKSALAKGPTCD